MTKYGVTDKMLEENSVKINLDEMAHFIKKDHHIKKEFCKKKNTNHSKNNNYKVEDIKKIISLIFLRIWTIVLRFEMF